MAAVAEETGGNAFFVREVILHLLEERRDIDEGHEFDLGVERFGDLFEIAEPGVARSRLVRRDYRLHNFAPIGENSLRKERRRMRSSRIDFAAPVTAITDQLSRKFGTLAKDDMLETLGARRASVPFAVAA